MLNQDGDHIIPAQPNRAASMPVRIDTLLIRVHYLSKRKEYAVHLKACFYNLIQTTIMDVCEVGGHIGSFHVSIMH